MLVEIWDDHFRYEYRVFDSLDSLFNDYTRILDSLDFLLT